MWKTSSLQITAAILSATGVLLPNLPSTPDAAALALMSDHGQVAGYIVDGPFALDIALSEEAAGDHRCKASRPCLPPRTDKAAAQLLSVPPGIIMTEHEAVHRDT